VTSLPKLNFDQSHVVFKASQTAQILKIDLFFCYWIKNTRAKWLRHEHVWWRNLSLF